MKKLMLGMCVALFSQVATFAQDVNYGFSARRH